MVDIAMYDALKGFDFSPWGGIEGFLEASKAGNLGQAATLKRLVPDLARAVDMTAVAVAGLPFDITNENGDVYDTSEDWQNNLGGIPNPQRLIYLLASSLCGGEAYLLPRRTPKFIYDLQYVAPQTIQPYIDINGLQWFDRMTERGKVERVYPNQIIYFWLPDSDIEIGPAENNPLTNSMLDAQLIWNMKNTMKIYGERGFVPITLLGAKGMPSDPEKKKTEAWFNRLLKGGFNTLAKIVNAEYIEIIRVGAGMDELKQSYLEIKREAKEGVADSFGIPTALFMSDNAFASEFDALRKQWYTASKFVGIYHTIEETMSSQLFKQYGYKMQFDLQRLEIFQEDESKRAASLDNFVIAVSTNPEIAKLGMGILGYDLTKEQENTLDKIIEEKKKPKEESQDDQDDSNDDVQQQRIENRQQLAELAREENRMPAKALSANEIKDLAVWYDRALTWHRKGKGSAADWENKHLREEVAAPIRLKLADAKSEDDITLAFGVSVPDHENIFISDAQTDAIKMLALAIEKAAQKGE